MRGRVNGVVAVASWIDPFGVAHSWSAPAVSVTINNGASTPPQLSIPSGMQTYFSPNGDGQEDTATVDFCLFKNANVDASAKVDATVVDASGATVRTIESRPIRRAAAVVVLTGAITIR